MVEVWIAENKVRMTPGQYQRLAGMMPPAMIERAGRFRRWQDAQAYLLGKYLLVEALRNHGVDQQVLEEIKYTTHNRPYLHLPMAIDFNISHSGAYIVCAVTREGKIGIDIEKVHDVDLHDFSSQFTDEELGGIQNASDKYDEFFRLWTIKEAVIKADGRGLSIPLKEIVIGDQAKVEDKIWLIHKLDIEPGYVAHLVVDNDRCGEIVLRRVPAFS